MHSDPGTGWRVEQARALHSMVQGGDKMVPGASHAAGWQRLCATNDQPRAQPNKLQLTSPTQPFLASLFGYGFHYGKEKCCKHPQPEPQEQESWLPSMFTWRVSLTTLFPY